MNLVRKLFLLRLKQCVRIIREGGISMWLLLPVLLFLLFISIKSLTDRYQVLFHFLNAFLLLFLNTGRKDLVFLRQFRTPGKLYLLLEYSFLVLLVDAYSLFRYPGKPYLLLPELAAIIVAVFFQEGHSRFPIRLHTGRRLTGFIPVLLYEWRSGLRQYFFLFVLFYIAGLAVLPFAPAAPFTLPFFSIFILDFFKEPDPPDIVQSYGTIGYILGGKMLANLAFCNLLFLPHYALFAYHYHDAFSIGGLLLSAYVLNVAVVYAIALKYAGFGQHTAAPVNIVRTIVFFIAAPVVPVSLYLCYREYNKAKCALSPYLK